MLRGEEYRASFELCKWGEIRNPRPEGRSPKPNSNEGNVESGTFFAALRLCGFALKAHRTNSRRQSYRHRFHRWGREAIAIRGHKRRDGGAIESNGSSFSEGLTQRPLRSRKGRGDPNGSLPINTSFSGVGAPLHTPPTASAVYTQNPVPQQPRATDTLFRAIYSENKTRTRTNAKHTLA
jgi:hypothetical protein